LPGLRGTGAAERLYRMDCAPAPARGEGGWRADRSGGGWGADEIPTVSTVLRPDRQAAMPAFAKELEARVMAAAKKAPLQAGLRVRAPASGRSPYRRTPLTLHGWPRRQQARSKFGMKPIGRVDR